MSARRYMVDRVPAGCPLTPRQLQAVQLLCEGLARREIGQRMGISPGTTSATLTRAYARLGVAGAAQARTLAFRSGWIDATPDAEPEAPLSPWLRALLAEFDTFLASGETDERAAKRQSLALAAEMDRLGVKRQAGPRRGQTERITRVLGAISPRGSVGVDEHR